MEKILCFIFAILGFCVSILIGTLICWGLGNLVILVFKINYTWTFLHGLVAELIYLLIKEIFNK